jgi:hypothetical protein
MNKPKFTPGPWSSSPQDGKPGHCFCAQVWDGNGNSLARVEPTDNEQEASASAFLMGKSPEMYDLLRRMATHKGDDLGLFAHEAAQIVKEIDNNN